MGCDYGGFNEWDSPECFGLPTIRKGDIIYHRYWGPCEVESVTESVGGDWAVWGTDLKGHMRYFLYQEADMDPAQIKQWLKDYEI